MAYATTSGLGLTWVWSQLGTLRAPSHVGLTCQPGLLLHLPLLLPRLLLTVGASRQTSKHLGPRFRRLHACILVCATFASCAPSIPLVSDPLPPCTFVLGLTIVMSPCPPLSRSVCAFPAAGGFTDRASNGFSLDATRPNATDAFVHALDVGRRNSAGSDQPPAYFTSDPAVLSVTWGGFSDGSNLSYRVGFIDCSTGMTTNVQDATLWGVGHVKEYIFNLSAFVFVFTASDSNPSCCFRYLPTNTPVVYACS